MRVRLAPAVRAVAVLLALGPAGPGPVLAAQPAPAQAVRQPPPDVHRPAAPERAQPAPAPAPAVRQPPKAEADPDKGTFLLTVFLRHDQSKPLAEIDQHLDRTGFYRKFPPDGVAVVSWYVAMGIGHVVTLRVPAERLREVNRVIEESAWGAYTTEFYPTYDYKALGETKREEALGHAP